MTAEARALRASRFVAARLPWLIGAGGLLVYVLTLNHWVSLYSLGTVARACGWWWRPELQQPLTFAALYPFRFLPEAWVPLALNVFNAVCAALVLVLLARSVALLPQDLPRTESFVGEQPTAVLATPLAWLPPLVATVLCGLQLSFWEHATSATGEMIDLLVLAYVLRCLLEFRLDPAQGWLSRAACIYGAGMANNWALLAFLPVFVAALLRLKGYGPFRERGFLLRMAAWGLAGSSMYLLLPLVCALSPEWEMGFGTALKAHLKSQREMLGYLRRPAFGILAATSLLPILVLSIRWKSHSVQFGDDSRLGVFLTKTTVHIVHAFFFLGTFWLALDPTFGPRHLELGTPLLGYYYLCALVFGYCAGYFLVFGARRASEVPGIGPGRLWGRIYAALQSRAPRLAVGAGIMLACALPALLAGKNLHQILTTNGPFLRTSVRQIYTDLPAGKSVVLSDSTPELLLLQAELSTHQDEKQPLLLETPALASAQYQRVMARKFPDRWPQSAPTNRAGGVGPGKILELVAAFTAREPVLQLQPSFGLWLEIFSERPSGCVYYLEPRKADDTTQLPRGAPTVKVAQPGTDATVAGSQALAGQLADRAEQVWQHRWTELLEKVAETTRNNARFPPGPGRALRVGLRLASEPNRTATFIGAAYSRRLNDWGVRRQCLGRAQDAKQWFERALALNPENLTARINLEYAERCQRGDRARLNVASFESEYSGLFARQSDWRASLGANGPVDEPSFLFRTGRLLLALGSPRQAIAAFARAAELAPDWPAPKLWQAQGYVQVRDFAAALGVTEQIQPPNLPQDGAGLARLLDCRAAALLGLGRTNEAARCLESFLSQYANYDEVLLVASEIYAQHQQFEAGLRLVEELLARAPNRPDLLARKGLAQLQLSRYDAAIITLTTALTLAPRNDEVRLYRAVAYLGAEQFGAARADYQELLKTPAHHGNALFGLGTIAWQQQETNVAIGYYQQYLSNSVPGSSQYAVAVGRLEALQSKEVK